jgi:tetratricopeptide (TPR) repeat protein
MSMNRFAARFAIGAAVAIGAAGSFYAGIAYASDARLDQAIDNCTKAVALLEAASNDGAKRPQNFHGFRKKAIGELKDAIKYIEKAKKFDDKTPAPPASGTPPS